MSQISLTWTPSGVQLDKIRGALWGVVLGDVLGHPYEFRGGKEYKDEIVQNGEMKLGTVSDDTEMMLACFRSLFNNRGDLDYDVSNTVYYYTHWATSEPWDIGYNTRTLFSNPIDKYMLYYNASMKNIKNSPSSTWSQSNGCLMRCAPLILFNFERMVWRDDCALSNPHPICLEASDLYFEMLYMLLGVRSRKSLSLDWSVTSCIREAISQVLNGEDRNVRVQRGWVVHGLYFAMKMYHNEYKTFSEGMREVIGEHLDSDTDTNAAIAGAILGCKLGYAKMNEDDVTKDNLRKIKGCSTERTKRYPMYHPVCIDKYLQKLFPLRRIM